MNATSPSSQPLVTLVVSPRERFSCVRQSLESIYEHTHYPFELIYIDGGSPTSVKAYLAEQAAERQFSLLRTEYYLSPNRARNLGLRQVTTPYVVFMDNDVVVTPGWLESLVECLEATGATIVSPLICQGTPLHEIVHCAGGESGVRIETKGETVERRIIEKIYKQGKRVDQIRSQLQRQETGLAEFHCMIVRTEIFEKLGSLDEGLLNTKEHVDLCMLVAESGGKIYLEPDSIVTYVPGPPLAWSDLHFFMLRWSNAWERDSLKRLQTKWNLTADEYFQNKQQKLGWRRKLSILHPLAHKLSFGNQQIARLLRAGLGKVDRVLNEWITTRYAQQLKQSQQQLDQGATSASTSSTVSSVH
jgi:GT2 family glycosyltransferase